MTESAPPLRTSLAPYWIDFQVTHENGKEPLKAQNLPDSLIESVLTAGASPKLEIEGDTALWLLRLFDEEADRRAASPRELTNKLGVFLRGGEIITAHRFASKLELTGTPANAEEILLGLLDKTLRSYADALARDEALFDALEAGVFGAKKVKPFRIKDAYFMKRRLTVVRKMLVALLEMIDSALMTPALAKLPLKPFRKRCGITLATCNTLIEQTNQLIQLHLAFISQRTNEASQRTNEVMRVLTVFSAFFLPLSFIAGVYGMNFQHMPELPHPYGYPGALALMGVVAYAIFHWFRRKGWIGKNPHRRN